MFIIEIEIQKDTFKKNGRSIKQWPTKGHTLQNMGTTKETIGRTKFSTNFAPFFWEYYANRTTRI